MNWILIGKAGFNEFWDTKNDFDRIFETYEIKETLEVTLSKYIF